MTGWKTALTAAALVCLGGCVEISRVSVEPSFPFDGKMRMAVLDFDWAPPVGKVAEGRTMVNAPNAGKYVADCLSARLLGLEDFEVLERSRIAQLLAEKDLSQTQLVSQGRYQEIGKFLGVDFLVLGTVNSYTSWAYGRFRGHTVSFSCRCVEVKTAKMIWTLSGQVEAGPMGPMDPSWGLNRILDEGVPKLKRFISAQRAANRQKAV